MEQKSIRHSHSSCYTRLHYRIHTHQPLDPPDSHIYALLIMRQFLTSLFYGRHICSLSLQFCTHFSSSHARHTLGPSHSPRFHNLEVIRSRVQITKLFINRFAICLPKDCKPTLFLGSDRRMNKRRWSTVQMFHSLALHFYSYYVSLSRDTQTLFANDKYFCHPLNIHFHFTHKNIKFEGQI